MELREVENRRQSRAVSKVTWSSPKPQSHVWASEILLSSLLTHPNVAFFLSLSLFIGRWSMYVGVTLAV